MPSSFPQLSEIEAILLEDPGRPALGAREIADRLDLPRSQRPRLRRELQRWVAEGRLIGVRRRRYGSPKVLGDVVGRLERHPAGYGFVIPDDASLPDLFIPEGLQGDALHGDIVAAAIEDVREDGRRQGRIVRALERRSESILGTLSRTLGGGGVVEPVDAGYGFDVLIAREGVEGAETGELVRVRIERYPSAGSPAMGRVVERLGRLDDPGVEIRAVIRRHDLPEEFPQEVLDEVEALPGESGEWPTVGRRNFTTDTVVTIDGKTAKDFDDAISVKRIDDGGYRLDVHIADVAYFVEEGSAIDAEALRRGTSVYFSGRVVPMLPERLSNDLCSLRPRQLRLTQGVSLDFDASGSPRGVEFHRGFIRSAARLTYEQVHRVVDERDAEMIAELGPAAEMLETASELARLLLVRRARRGAIDIDLPEREIVLSRSGWVEDVVARSRVHSHRMIEEFMIAANEAVAGHLRRHREPTLYRVHESPDPVRIARLRETLDGLGYASATPGEKPTPATFAEIARMAAGQPEETLVQRVLLRSMSLARYDRECLGHFGLALRRYLHFTSPIRRYPDLVAHRALARLIDGARESSGERGERRARLPELAVECSRLERIAESAERECSAWQTASFMSRRIGEVFSGRVVDVTAAGLAVELDQPYVEGFVPLVRLGGGRDGFRFDERRRRLVERGGSRVYRLGQELEVCVDRVDVLAHRIDFAPADSTLDLERRPRRKGRRSLRRSRGQQRPNRSRGRNRRR